MVLSWQIWFLVQSPYELEIFQISITSSKISFGTQFKAHIVANRAALHLRLKKLLKDQNKTKVVQGIVRSTLYSINIRKSILSKVCRNIRKSLCKIYIGESLCSMYVSARSDKSRLGMRSICDLMGPCTSYMTVRCRFARGVIVEFENTCLFVTPPPPAFARRACLAHRSLRGLLTSITASFSIPKPVKPSHGP
jgi:hypothetical protein